MRAARISLCLLTALIAGAWAGRRFWPQHLDLRPAASIPEWERVEGKDEVRYARRFLVATIACYDDEFFAYLMFAYLRGHPMFKNSEILLTYTRSGNGLLYPVRIHLRNDLIASPALLFQARAMRLIQEPSWESVPFDTLARLRYETRLFVTAYNFPAKRKLEDLTRTQLVAYIRRFVRFKSMTDSRVRRGTLMALQPLTNSEARQLAEDIVKVADFYAIPLDFFLGIGAMENNYLNVDGDLQHATWKKRAEKGDVILKRKRGRVLVLNSSSGVWQITRETLRYAHGLYLKDQRDYSMLPERLRPSRELDIVAVAPAILTTYAGLLFRDLLDRSNGDTLKAVGAYNGGLGNPNLQYAEGVRRVAEYARRTMEHAAVLNGPAADQRFLVPGR